MNIGMVGVGYVGLVSGCCFSDFGHNVTFIDKDVGKIKKLKKMNLPIYEPGLESLLRRNFAAGRIVFKTKLSHFVSDLDVIFIAVGTPTRRESSDADLSNIYAVFEELKKYIKNNQTLVIKSTVPVGTNHKILNSLEHSGGKVYDLVSNPEFLREGSAIEDFMRPDRIIIGLRTERAKKVIMEVYKPLYLRDFPIMFTDPKSAELIKYSSNAFLATKVSFINEIATLCEKVDADVKEVAKGMGLDKRIGNKFLHAGPGYGGSCFPKDTLAFVELGRSWSCPQQIVETVIAVNDKIKQRMIEKIMSVCDNSLEGKTVVILGITFKPNTDDMREAPSLTIIPAIQSNGANVRVVDPQGKKEGKRLLAKVSWFSNCYDAASDADMVVILTEWNEFRALDLVLLVKKMKSPIMVDLRNIYSKQQAEEAGFKKYISLGR